MASGRIVHVVGPVIDVEFYSDALPNLYNALLVRRDPPLQDLVLEVAEHIGNNVVRCIAMSSTRGLARGIDVEDTGAAISVPVGEEKRQRLPPDETWLSEEFTILGPRLETRPFLLAHPGAEPTFRPRVSVLADMSSLLTGSPGVPGRLAVAACLRSAPRPAIDYARAVGAAWHCRGFACRSRS